MQNKKNKLGCDLCKEIRENDTPVSLDEFYENIYVYLKMCRNCDKPSCIEACSGDGIHWDKNNNQIVFNEENCVKCNMCIMLCPFDAIRSHEQSNYTCATCEKYPILMEKIHCFNQEKNNPLMNELMRENFAKQLINKGF